MPKRIIISKGWGERSGIEVTFYKTSKRIYFSGWYDGCVGIEGEEMALGEFFKRLGITEKDCRAAFKTAAETEVTE